MDTERVVRKTHENLAHCGRADLIRVLKHSNAPAAALDITKTLRCDTCDRNTDPKISKNSKVTKATSPFSEITMDVEQLPGWLPQQRIKVLHILDEATALAQADRLGPLTASSVRDAYRRIWKKPYVPLTV